MERDGILPCYGESTQHGLIVGRLADMLMALMKGKLSREQENMEDGITCLMMSCYCLISMVLLAPAPFMFVLYMRVAVGASTL